MIYHWNTFISFSNHSSLESLFSRYYIMNNIKHYRNTFNSKNGFSSFVFCPTIIHLFFFSFLSLSLFRHPPKSNPILPSIPNQKSFSLSQSPDVSLSLSLSDHIMGLSCKTKKAVHTLCVFNYNSDTPDRGIIDSNAPPGPTRYPN